MKQLIAQLRAQLAAGTPGEWEVEMGRVHFDQYNRIVTSEANAQLIVTLRNNAEALLDYIEKLEALHTALIESDLVQDLDTVNALEQLKQGSNP